jgi:proteasome lid subunit RPN8/RPN11
MDKELCKRCNLPIEPMAKYCNWCGAGPYARVSKQINQKCPDCGEAISPLFSYCPWQKNDLGGDKKPRQKIKGFKFNVQCPNCKGGILKTMAYCPWCNKDLLECSFEGKEQCPKCKRYLDKQWQRCVFCGAFAESAIVRLNPKQHIKITKEALLFLCLATGERQREKRNKWVFFEEAGFETIGLLFGEKRKNVYKITYAYPVASAESSTDQVVHNQEAEKALIRIIEQAHLKDRRIGLFHSHPNEDWAYPSTADIETTKKGSLEVIVAVRRTNKSQRWKWNAKENLLEGSIGSFYFRIFAYIINKSVVEALKIKIV